MCIRDRFIGSGVNLTPASRRRVNNELDAISCKWLLKLLKVIKVSQELFRGTKTEGLGQKLPSRVGVRHNQLFCFVI